MLLTRRTCLAIVALTLCAGCGHAPAPEVEEPTAEQPETETAAQDTPDPACAEAVVCEGEYEAYDTTYSGDLVFWEQHWLTRIDLPCLTEVEGDLFIETNDALTSLEGLQGINEVGGDLGIRDNATLPRFHNLESLRTYLRSNAQ